MVEDVGCNYISNSSPTRHPKRETNNTEAVKGMNIEILPPKRERQIFRPTHHFQKHSPRRARPSHEMRVGNSCRQELTSPKYPLRDRIKLIPQQRLHHFSTQSGTWTMTEELKKTLWTTQRPMMRRIIQTYRKTKKMSRNRTRSKRRRYRRRRTPRPRQRAGGRHD